jgi:hypothetical protein
MKDYCCQIYSSSGRILEIFHEDFLVAMREATKSVHEQGAKRAYVFRYPDMTNPIGASRTIK